jgi:hypothetical protein
MEDIGHDGPELPHVYRLRPSRRLAVLTLAAFVAGAAPTDPFFARDAAPLAAPFSAFTGEDALAAIFPSYRPGSSAVDEIRDDDGIGPAHVGVAEAEPWLVAGGPYVVVRFRISTTPARHDVPCFDCGENDGLAVLARRAGRLHAVATVYGDAPGAIDTLSNGPAGREWLDLAPYRFDATRTLIGVRSDHTTGDGDYAQALCLFLMRGAKLVPVATFHTEAWRAHLTGDVAGRETFSDVFEQSRIVVSPRGGGEPNDLVLQTRLLECRGQAGEIDTETCLRQPGKIVTRDWASERYRYTAARGYVRIGRGVRHLF